MICSDAPSMDSLSSLSFEFRKRMSEGQAVGRCNAFRKAFYDDVVELAIKVCKFILAMSFFVPKPLDL